ncbi:MAG: sulfotransferase [Nitrospiria bacterium]
MRTATMPAVRRLLHRALPAHFPDPFGLALRLIRSGDRAARFAMAASALGVAAWPLDAILGIIERRNERLAAEPRLPIVIVVGAPRTGTTVTAQALAAGLPVSYFNNLSEVFPRSPITANRLFGSLLRPSKPTYTSYYGRSPNFSGFSDGLQLWDRWLGPDRKHLPSELTEERRRDMRRFFGAFEQAFGKPIVNKHNSLNTRAHLVAAALPTAHFIAMTRDPVFLAQSLYKARLDILGDVRLWYGVEEDHRPQSVRDPIQDVCEQVRFHEGQLAQQQALIGPKRFWVVGYEEFCADPRRLVRRVGEEILGLSGEGWRDIPARFEVSNRPHVTPKVFDAIRRTLAERGASVCP